MNLPFYYRHLLFIGICLSFNPLAAQLNTTYLSGKIELRNGKKKEGLIRADAMDKMNFRINFKDSVSTKQLITYDTASVSSFTLSNGEIYERLLFKLDGFTDSMPVLANLLIKGSLSLYKFSFKGKLIFLVKNAEKIYALQDDELDSPSSTEITKHNFKNLLYTAILNDSKFLDKINQASFKEKDFINIVTSYNKQTGAEQVIVQSKSEQMNFILLNAGYGARSGSDYEMQLSLIYRVYFPRISRGTSLNIGLNYFNGKFPTNTNYYSPYNTFNLVTLPLQFQENILNKNIRPYVFAGFNFSYYKQVDKFNVLQNDKGFQNKFGFSFLAGLGLEVTLYKGLLVKGEFRYENFTHPILFGLTYAFKTTKK